MSEYTTRSCAHPVSVETRSTLDGDGKTAVGYAAVFYREDDNGTEFELFEGAYERISPLAFDRALRQKQDVRALFNHDPNKVLGSVGAGTLRLKADNVGLRYEIDLPDTETGREVATLLERGDIKGSSFGFRPVETRWIEGKPAVRELIDVDVRDVGPVTFPAYTATSAETGANN